MPAHKSAEKRPDDSAGARGRVAGGRPRRNEVHLIGRVADVPVERELPSGDTVVTVRLIVDRDGHAATRTGQRVDTIDCVAWIARLQRSIRRWQAGDEVEVSGSLRRRFYRVAEGPRSRFEVELTAARRPRRQTSAPP